MKKLMWLAVMVAMACGVGTLATGTEVDNGLGHLSQEAQAAVRKLPRVMQDECKIKGSPVANDIMNQLAIIAEAEEAIRLGGSDVKVRLVAENARRNAMRQLASLGLDLCKKNCRDPLEEAACDKDVRKYYLDLENKSRPSWWSFLVGSITSGSKLPITPSESKSHRSHGEITLFLDKQEKKLVVAGKSPEEIRRYKVKVWDECKYVEEDMQKCGDRIWEALFKEHNQSN